MTDAAPKAMTEAEYLRTERESPYKREYVGGFVYPLHAQAGSSGVHARISMNIAGHLYAEAMRQGCRLYQSDMKLYILGGSSYFYPDVMLVCGHEPHDAYSETAPCLLVEVLSGITADTDRRHKYAAYTALPSLQTYLIVSQDTRHAVEYRRTEDGWRMHEHHGSGEIRVACVDHTLTLDEIYRGVL